jgi:hypothetical protein
MSGDLDLTSQPATAPATGNTTDKLRDDVAGEILGPDPSHRPERYCHRRIELRAGHVADGVSHGGDRQIECQRDRQNPNRKGAADPLHFRDGE